MKLLAPKEDVKVKGAVLEGSKSEHQLRVVALVKRRRRELEAHLVVRGTTNTQESGRKRQVVWLVFYVSDSLCKRILMIISWAIDT